jgi:ATP adenylyltransferase
MEHLWSPWRAAYVTDEHRHTSTDCFLCSAAEEGSDDAEWLVAARFPSTIVVINRFPYNAGHVLIAPKVHEGNLARLTDAQAQELMTVTRLVIRALEDEVRPHGCNIGINMGSAAGAGVPDHLHVHCVPRWNGDTNFMPVLGETKVISELLPEMRKRIAQAIARVRIE